MTKENNQEPKKVVEKKDRRTSVYISQNADRQLKNTLNMLSELTGEKDEKSYLDDLIDRIEQGEFDTKEVSPKLQAERSRKVLSTSQAKILKEHAKKQGFPSVTEYLGKVILVDNKYKKEEFN